MPSIAVSMTRPVMLPCWPRNQMENQCLGNTRSKMGTNRWWKIQSMSRMEVTSSFVSKLIIRAGGSHIATFWFITWRAWSCISKKETRMKCQKHLTIFQHAVLVMGDWLIWNYEKCRGRVRCGVPASEMLMLVFEKSRVFGFSLVLVLFPSPKNILV